MVFERNFLGSPCLLACLISRKTTQAFKNHCYLPLTWVAMTEKWCVLLSCPSFITHMHFWKNKNMELRLFFFMAPLQTRLHLGPALPVHTLRRVAKETRNKDDFMHSKQENASAPQIFIRYCRLTVSFLSLTGVLKNNLKELHMFF